MIEQTYVVTTPTDVEAGVAAHALIPTGPLSDQVTLPVAAADPVVPVIVAVKTMLAPSPPPPDTVRTIGGATFAITTTVEDAGASAV